MSRGIPVAFRRGTPGIFLENKTPERFLQRTVERFIQGTPGLFDGGFSETTPRRFTETTSERFSEGSFGECLEEALEELQAGTLRKFPEETPGGSTEYIATVMKKLIEEILDKYQRRFWGEFMDETLKKLGWFFQWNLRKNAAVV